MQGPGQGRGGCESVCLLVWGISEAQRGSACIQARSSTLLSFLSGLKNWGRCGLGGGSGLDSSLIHLGRHRAGWLPLEEKQQEDGAAARRWGLGSWGPGPEAEAEPGPEAEPGLRPRPSGVFFGPVVPPLLHLGGDRAALRSGSATPGPVVGDRQEGVRHQPLLQEASRGCPAPQQPCRAGCHGEGCHRLGMDGEGSEGGGTRVVVVIQMKTSGWLLSLELTLELLEAYCGGCIWWGICKWYCSSPVATAVVTLLILVKESLPKCFPDLIWRGSEGGMLSQAVF